MASQGRSPLRPDHRQRGGRGDFLVSTAETRYAMLCRCGIEWHTTNPERQEHATCRGIGYGTGKAIGCGRKLPAPVPERRED